MALRQWLRQQRTPADRTRSAGPVRRAERTRSPVAGRAETDQGSPKEGQGLGGPKGGTTDDLTQGSALYRVGDQVSATVDLQEIKDPAAIWMVQADQDSGVGSEALNKTGIGDQLRGQDRK